MENKMQVFTNEEFGELHVRVLDNGEIEINLEDSARGLGFTRIANSGNEVVRWERVNGYLAEFGLMPTSGHDTYIPEHIFYRLAMKAKNAA